MICFRLINMVIGLEKGHNAFRLTIDTHTNKHLLQMICSSSKQQKPLCALCDYTCRGGEE
jgi:hypothetical protein